MASSNARNLNRQPNAGQRMSTICANCCHYCPRLETPTQDAQKSSEGSEISGFFTATVILIAALFMFATANATPVPEQEIAGDIRESLLPYDSESQ